MEPLARLTDLRLKSLVKQPRGEEMTVAEGSVPGLMI